MTDDQHDRLGPIDYVLVEFPGNEFNGEILPSMVELIAAGLADFLTDLVSREDLEQAADEMEPGTSAVLIVWENTWAVPFANAVRGSGGEVVASGRLAGVDVLDALADAGAGN